MLPAFCYSPRALEKPHGIVIHYFSAINVAPERWDDPDTCRDLFIDLNSPGPERGLVMPPSGEGRQYASAHWLIARDGHIEPLVPENHQAYHAGKSHWAGRDNLNAWTFGIELIATHTSGFTDDQYAACSALCAKLMSKYAIPLGNIVGHDQVATPAGRKKDPGPLFDWARLKESLRYIA